MAGPRDVIADAPVGRLDGDLRRAALAALEVPREQCRDHALRFSWEASARQFLSNLRGFDAAVWESGRGSGDTAGRG